MRVNGKWTGVLGILLLFGLVPSIVVAADDERDEGIERLRATLAEEHPDVAVGNIRSTTIDGLYEVVAGGEIVYLTEDGRYLIQGSLIDLHEQRDLTADARGLLAHEAVAGLRDSMLVYEAAGGDAEHVITVFTDHTCPYCQQLHEDLLVMIERDSVEVRYLMFPRQGPRSQAATTLGEIWCADDPHNAMNRAKRGESVPRADDDCDAPVDEHFATAQRIGVSGTPYVLINDDGPVFAGYQPREDLLELLAREAERRQASGE